MESSESAEYCCLHHAALEAFPNPVIIHDDVILYVNAAARKVLRAESPEQIIGKPVGDFVHPDGRAAGEQRRRMLVESGVAMSSIAVKLITLEGSVLYAIGDACRVIHEGRTAIMVTGRVTGERFESARA